MKEKDLLDKSLTCSLKDKAVTLLIQNFMYKQSGHIREVTYRDFVEFSRGSLDTRCSRVALFKKVTQKIAIRLFMERKDQEGLIVRQLMY